MNPNKIKIVSTKTFLKQDIIGYSMTVWLDVEFWEKETAIKVFKLASNRVRIVFSTTDTTVVLVLHGDLFEVLLNEMKNIGGEINE